MNEVTVFRAEEPKQAPQPKAEYQCPEHLVRAHCEMLQIEGIKVEKLRLEHESRKEAAKIAKEDYEEAMKHVARMAARRPEEIAPLLACTEDGAAENEAWREVPLEAILEGKTDAKLSKAVEIIAKRFSTIGKVARHTEANRRLTEIDGIGPAAEAMVADAIQDWFARNPSAWNKAA